MAPPITRFEAAIANNQLRRSQAGPTPDLPTRTPWPSLEDPSPPVLDKGTILMDFPEQRTSTSEPQVDVNQASSSTSSSADAPRAASISEMQKSSSSGSGGSGFTFDFSAKNAPEAPTFVQGTLPSWTPRLVPDSAMQRFGDFVANGMSLFVLRCSHYLSTMDFPCSLFHLYKSIHRGKDG